MSLFRTSNFRIITISELKDKTKKFMIKRSIKTWMKANKLYLNKIRH